MRGRLQTDYWFKEFDVFLDDLRKRARRLPNSEALHQLVLQFSSMRGVYSDLEVQIVLTSKKHIEDNKIIPVYQAPESFRFAFPGVKK